MLLRRSSRHVAGTRVPQATKSRLFSPISPFRAYARLALTPVFYCTRSVTELARTAPTERQVAPPYKVRNVGIGHIPMLTDKAWLSLGIIPSTAVLRPPERRIVAGRRLMQRTVAMRMIRLHDVP